MGSFKIQVPVVVNSNTAQVLVVTEIPLCPPAFKIDEIDKLIEIDDCAAVCDKVIINGRLIKSIRPAVDANRPGCQSGYPGLLSCFISLTRRTASACHAAVPPGEEIHNPVE
ncbi:MAG TPA: hypothetical protein VD902_09595 [Symbiobacteriaceae bacterium]|nr:hypothetical protein [Symbiobacteriaceae bacterium]